ncbi:NCS2 family permease [Mangrovibacterium diazotrophicum]|uniref:AGZA family xanthine/uracil permease-like MFS transporter n=1 Tax=Mangrovibacterium diazotrophicum TaxID=1261403 RepID=A0A419WAL9_9BACT|nr:NCS2 family permease [Mangrovibacterium diazotrophicum]RKD92520.1 AGZA family xanthine/uracil permease-like MFS transporter [Mangrovibacterium diazotrophicum]
MLDKYFSITERGSSIKKEIIGGATTFLTMAYIIFVNPNILGDAGMDKSALITVTILASVIGTILAGVWARVPYAMAPGMGLNAFFTYTLVLGAGVPWQTALGVVFISGVVFLLLTVTKVRTKIIHTIPLSLRLATGAGIGLFIAFIGFKSMGLVVANPATFVGLGKFTPTLLIGIAGLVITAVLEVKKVRGGIFYGIIITTIIALIAGQVTPPDSLISMPPSISPLVLQLDVLSALKFSLIGAIFSFMFVDLFDSVGTIVACSYEAGFVDKDGKVEHVDRILEADAVATVAGALLGTSTTTTYIESASGIANGAKTGFASVVTAGLFLLALLFAPIIGIVPAYATAPALIIVGVYMFKNIKQINFTDFSDSIPAFLTIILMPLTYSISTGLSFGFISFILLKSVAGKFEEISWLMWIIGALSVVNLWLGV